ncbi:hybrid sensor histidine kinase/response regulator [Paramagnetospirillum kuznetsovii]|uniref:histidine kinase n=1 Tax=Paramagnetospirillum kuznetsovii TaxID=2053833 RepID=A0A364NXA1_9PROT|nr:response regulator [Paramagnetospirillum kuznetsovii]RAU21537.1 hybrid sensor histidine kinase/response regulator [Paramagnetospirillum kuznetsovii]
MTEDRLILIVEDSVTQAIRLQFTLDQEGFQTAIAASGEEALDYVNRQLPDLIIVDYHLPGIQGDELCRQIHMDITTRGIPLLMLTADDTAAVELHGLESGADDFVAKSEDADILLLRVHNLLRKSRHKVVGAEVGRSLFRRARVLIIDDSNTYRQSLAMELNDEGCDVFQVTSGAEGLAALDHSDFDCIMVDMVMPGMDGIAVCKALAERRAKDDAPLVVLMLSAYETKENVARALEAGADDFVGKSAEMSVLRARLRALLRRKFLLEQNQRILDEIRLREAETLRAKAEKEAAEARAALVEGLARVNLELGETNAKLVKEVELRSVAEHQALAARETAETANRAKTVFLANMSHELRTPLNAVLGFAELAASVMDKDALAQYGDFLDNITESAQHLLGVISDILDVSRVEVGKVVLRESDMDVSEIVRSVTRLIDHVVIRKHQTMTTNIASSLPGLRGDARLIKQILLNLVSNAAKFTPERGKLHLDVHMRDGAICIVVEDNGVGIAAEDLTMVLQPFGQAESAISPKQEGTGLGLPLAKGFVELHGGILSLDSEPGRGTRVTVLFPATRTVTAGQ